MQFLRGFAPFLDYHYWLNPSPVPLGPSLAGGILVFFAWFLIAALALYLVNHGMKKDNSLKAENLKRIAHLLSTTGFLGLIFLFFSYEQLPFLGMRFWFFLLFILFIAWLIRIIIYIVRDYPKKKAEKEERSRLEKYLPKKKE